MNGWFVSDRGRTGSLFPEQWSRRVKIAYVSIFFFMLGILLVLLSSAGNFSAGAITNISTTLLTVEGILTGFSLLSEEAKGKTIPMLLAMIAITWSLITVISAQIITDLQSKFPTAGFTPSSPTLLFGRASLFGVFLVDVFLFIFTIGAYVLISAKFQLPEVRKIIAGGR
jgi:hypothetical protein